MADDRRRVIIATPTYDHTVTTEYVRSLMATRDLLDRNGVNSLWLTQGGSAILPWLRNRLAYDALLHDCDDLVFVDADVSWDPNDFLRLLSHDADIVGGVMPTPDSADGRQVKYPFRPLDGGLVSFDDQGIGEVAGLPTAFLRIRARVLQELSRHVPNLMMDGDLVPVWFDFVIRDLGIGQQYLGEDIAFCALARDHGFRVMLDSAPILGHRKSLLLKGSVRDVFEKAEPDG